MAEQDKKGSKATKKVVQDRKNRHFSISLSKEDFTTIKKNQDLLKMSRSKYVALAATNPNTIAASLYRQSNPNLPKTLRWANADYNSAILRSPNISALSESQDYRAIEVEYYNAKNDPGLINFQRSIRDAARESFSLGRLDFINIKYAESYTGGFDVVRRAGLLFENPTLCLFPFLLTELRRPFWGVIAYGQHMRVGIYFKDIGSKLLADWQKMVGADSSALVDETGRNLMPKKVYGWFNRLIDSFSESSAHGKLYTTEGYIHQEIIQYLLAHYGPKYSTRNFDKFIRPALIKDIHNESFLDKSDALMFDLSQITTLPPAQVVEFPHGLDIPVGIGFSLGMWPRLKEEDNWKTLLNKSIELLKDSQYKSALHNGGIDIGTNENEQN